MEYFQDVELCSLAGDLDSLCFLCTRQTLEMDKSQACVNERLKHLQPVISWKVVTASSFGKSGIMFLFQEFHNQEVSDFVHDTRC